MMKSEPRESGLLEFHNFLFELYRIAGSSGFTEFHDHVFDLMNRLIHFNSGWWGISTGIDQKALVAKAVLYRLPPEFLVDYARLQDQDVLNEKLGDQLGVTLTFTGEIPGETPALRQFDRKYRLHSIMSTVQVDPASGAGFFISVFRDETEPPYSENERQLMQMAMPHVVQAWSHNLRLAIANISPGKTSDSCFIDGAGKILDASPGFVTALLSEFPEWQGGTLQANLLETLLHDQRGIYRGKRVDIWRVGAAGAAPIKIQCGHIQSSGLTPREAAVAAAFATGRSYKEIAITLELSPATVRSYLQQCYSKLDVTNKVELGRALSEKSGRHQLAHG